MAMDIAGQCEGSHEEIGKIDDRLFVESRIEVEGNK